MSQSQDTDHNHTEYNLPRNDAAEFARLEDQANAFLEFMSQKIVHAPLDRPQEILEVGCGTGNVCRYLAQQYREASIYGVDITPVPPFARTPPNISYLTGDIQRLAGSSDPRLPTGHLDYIYQRLLLGGMTSRPAHVRQMASLLRPGGYLEMHEGACRWYMCSAASSPPGVPRDDDHMVSADWRWHRAVRQGAERLGLDIDVGRNALRYMQEAGLVDVVARRYVLPVGTWFAGERPETRRIGEHQAVNLGKAFSEFFLPGVTRELGIGDEEMRGLQEECRRCLAAEEGKYWWFYVTVGRKV